MHIQTLVAILAVSVLVVELAFAHLPQIILMQVVAGIALLAQALEPVLADIVVIRAAEVAVGRLRGCGMAVWTSSAQRTVA